jgi:hypothetical protein
LSDILHLTAARSALASGFGTNCFAVATQLVEILPRSWFRDERDENQMASEEPMPSVDIG